MTTLVSLFSQPRLRGWVVAAVAISAAALVWVGYRAVTEWQHAASLVASRRADSAVELLMTALSRDMHGAQTTVLSSADRDGLTMGPPIDLMQPIANGLARYSYVELFFAWSEQRRTDPVIFYVRGTRRPAWLVDDGSDGTVVPVVTARNPAVAMRLMNRVRSDAAQGRRFSVFDLAIEDRRYQVVTILSYADSLRERPSGVLGYVVDVDWTRQHYFAQVASEVASIEGSDQGLRYAIADDHGAMIGEPPSRPTRAPMAQRTFPVTFFDPLLVSLDPPKDLKVSTATAMAITGADPALATAERGARRTLVLAAVTAAVLIASLVLSLQAGRATARLSDMRSDFVSAVTHELKAPIANLRAIHQTVASGRLNLEATREYAEMGVREATRLGRLVENLLAYARITDVADAYSFEPVPLKQVVDASLEEFAAHLADAGFEVHTMVPQSLPQVRADRTALALLLNNLIDNAIRYSPSRRVLTIRAAERGAMIELSVADQGIGISAADREHVVKRFFRGRHPGAAGSGLGLAIVDRIVRDHAGLLEIESEPGQGTTVAISLPRVA